MIPPTWETLLALSHANNLDTDWALGVMTISATPGKMSYTACVPGDASCATPDGMVEVAFAGGTYVGCEHVGLLDSIGETTAWFYGQTFPRRSIKSPRARIWRYTTRGSILTWILPS
jgi:predicted transcriptional regulator YdeE